MEWEIMDLNSSAVRFTIVLDWISLTFIRIVSLISLSVVIYSESYMQHDLYMNRFIILVRFFIASMFLLILSLNLMGILLGWDGLGLTSYCLIIYFQNNRSCQAGMLTALANRVGDAALIIGVCWISNYGCWNYLFYENSYFIKYI